MAESHLKTWEILFQRALLLIDSVAAAGIHLTDWSFGGGTVLMRRHQHRYSKDIDIFVSDPQFLGFLSPRLNTEAERLASGYAEQANFVKLYFAEGEIDFVASAPLTASPTRSEILLGRAVQVETSTEIIAKKIWHRGEEFTARDIFDLAMVIEREPESLRQIRPILRDRRQVILDRIARNGAPLREVFDALEVLNYQRGFDDCVALIVQTLDAAT